MVFPVPHFRSAEVLTLLLEISLTPFIISGMGDYKVFISHCGARLQEGLHGVAQGGT